MNIQNKKPVCRWAWLALAGGLLLSAAPGAVTPAFAADPQQVNFTLEGCRSNGTIALPNVNGDFICPDAAYTTGNLGKSWNELDLVPYRLTAAAGNSAPATQTYTIAVVVDNKDSGAPGYDFLQLLTLNAALSSASCSVPSVGGELIAAPGLGASDESRYRLVTITQPKNTTCVYDYYARLAIGSHMFEGSSLHANLANATLGTGGIGSKEVSIPVNEIEPQSISKTMSAMQGSSFGWMLNKQGPASVSFGDVCAVDAPQPQSAKLTVTWTRAAATPGMITITTIVKATNPAARTITVSVEDKIYKGADQTTLLDDVIGPPVNIPANSMNVVVLTHTITRPSGDDTFYNDVATATYTDLATSVPVPGNAMATASAPVTTGTVSSAEAVITDSESLQAPGLRSPLQRPQSAASLVAI